MVNNVLYLCVQLLEGQIFFLLETLFINLLQAIYELLVDIDRLSGRLKHGGDFVEEHEEPICHLL